MDPIIVAILGCVILVILFCLKVPIAFSMGIAGLAGLLILKGGNIAVFDILLALPYAKVSGYTMSVIGMFVLMGQMAWVSGISSDAFDSSRKIVGRFPGGMGVATVFACAVFGAACGSSMAEAAAMGRVAIPEMRKAGYEKKFASGIVASAGMLAWLIPPSVQLAIYGIITEESIGKLLIAGFIPGILTAIVIAVTIILISKFQKGAAGIETTTYSFKERISVIPKFLPIFLLFLIILVGLYSGVFTPTEAGAVGAFVAMIFCVVALIQKRTTWPTVKRGVIETVEMVAMMFMILVGAGIFSFMIGMCGIPTLFQDFIIGSNISPALLLLLVCLLYIPMGMFLEPMSIQLLTLPIIFPVIIHFGFSGIWFGIVICKLIEIAMLTPPVGLNVYVIKGIVPDLSLEEAFKGVTPFIIGQVILTVILILIPQLSTWLPGMMMGK